MINVVTTLRRGILPATLVVLLLAPSVQAKAPKSNQRVVILGVDGVTFNVLNPLIKAGRLPNIERLMDVKLTVTIELGRTRDTIENVMEYGDQSLIELDRSVGEPVEVLVNGELFARGEVVTVSENFGVRILELVNPLTHN